eukprot:CAMPEP_0175841682 /NCGR_PEP_ID=MMETSP0107_2-20121207/20071_1 /TAXON_ID=195067 ORGANISM="Goniomonas pacifica, Strain CCMP1869" /NCGR_SAMPLE_ID=MMETSP0107_2 /ASSEMBLY_ACC=CAM_ASM_000203 /LENGTH=180 /DNA_ID=CAMNT_0017155689 /DNA_START=59 /DNA_END=601 /DNA_ORIENTATION=-
MALEVASHGVNHVLDGVDLRCDLGGVVGERVSPPVPAALGVVRGHVADRRLRIQDDHVVGLGPLVESRVLDEGVADGAQVLLTAVEGDVEFALAPAGALGRDVRHTGGSQRDVRGCDLDWSVKLLRKGNDARGLGGRAVDEAILEEKLQHLARGIDVTIVDVGGAKKVTVVAELVCDPSM